MAIVTMNPLGKPWFWILIISVIVVIVSFGLFEYYGWQDVEQGLNEKSVIPWWVWLIWGVGIILWIVALILFAVDYHNYWQKFKALAGPKLEALKAKGKSAFSKGKDGSGLMTTAKQKCAEVGERLGGQMERSGASLRTASSKYTKPRTAPVRQYADISSESPLSDVYPTGIESRSLYEAPLPARPTNPLAKSGNPLAKSVTPARRAVQF